MPRHGASTFHLPDQVTADEKFSLAYAEIHLALAMIMRRFDFELCDTDFQRDIEVVRDCFLGEPRPGSSGVRVKVTSVLA